MKRPQSLLVLAAAVLAVLSQRAWSEAQPPKENSDVTPLIIGVSKADLLKPQYAATGQLSAVRINKTERGVEEKVLESFGAGAIAEQRANEFVAQFLGSPAPVIKRRVFTHLRCRKTLFDDDRGSAFDTSCDAVNIHYTLPTDPTDPTALAACNVSVDADVLVLGRRARTFSWKLDPPADLVPTNTGGKTPRVRLLDRAQDPSGQEVRGITFSDNSDDPRERGSSPPSATKLVFVSPKQGLNDQSVVWERAQKTRIGYPKVFYYAVVLQLWSDTLQDYVFCEPYDPTVPVRGN